MALTDKQYYSEFEGRVGQFIIGDNYPVGSIVRFENSYYELSQGAIANALAEEAPGMNANWVMFDAPVLGANRMITLEDIINNYFVLYNDDVDYGGMSKRFKIEALAKRAVQEFSYDTLRVKDQEYELIDIARIPMPQDFVELVSIGYTDEYGIERWLVPRRDSTNPQSILQFDNNREWVLSTQYLEGNVVRISLSGDAMNPNFAYYRALSGHIATIDNQPGTAGGEGVWLQVPATMGDDGIVYDDQGKAIFADDTSFTKQLFDNAATQRITSRGAGFTNNLSQYTTEGGFYTYGKRYYLDTETVNTNGTYFVDEVGGAIDIDPGLVGQVIVFRYVSDGLSNDPTEITLHKFAEQAMYEMIYYEMIARKSQVPANEKERAKRRMMAKKREAKLRLSQISKRELIQTLRAQARWIKT